MQPKEAHSGNPWKGITRKMMMEKLSNVKVKVSTSALKATLIEALEKHNVSPQDFLSDGMET
jgi:hypothetical protein